MEDSLYIVMPAYNEEANIEEVVKEWHEVVTNVGPESKLVVVNDGSKDNTYGKLLELKASYPQLEPLTKDNSGHGATLLYAYNYAVEKKADYIFQTDSDGQTNPAEFEKFWNSRKKYDGIFGYRNKRGDGKARAFVEKVVCMLLRIYFGVKVPDANAPFRLMKTDIVKKYLYKMKPDYNLPNIMMTTYFVYYKEKYRFIPISFKPRQGGVNSINIPKIIGIGWKALGDFRELKKDMK
jgi:glycosyltransferase involved in cell wall biosynthesis